MARLQLEDRDVELRAVSAAGNRWLEHLKFELSKLAETTVVAINVENGEYITAATRLDAIDCFEVRFGIHADGFLHEVGRPVFIGGGIV